MERRKKYNNGRRYSLKIKRVARNLRKRGWTHREIVKKLNISNGSAYLWTKGIILTLKQKQAIERRRNKRIFTLKDRMEIRKRLAPYRQKYSKNDFLNRIHQFYRQNKRIPLKREFNNYHGYRKYFGGWNNAIIAAGFEPNPELFAKRVEARDGHICDSFAEKIVDDWLWQHKIPHLKNVRYPHSKMTADFLIQPKNIFIEFFGLKGVNKKYDTNLQKKLRLVRKNNLKLISLYAEDIGTPSLVQKLESIERPS